MHTPALSRLSALSSLFADPDLEPDTHVAALSAASSAASSTPARATAQPDTPVNAHAPSPTGVRLELQHVGKRYGSRQVLSHIDLQVEPGEFIAVVGRSGCGKSTLLRLVAGLEQSWSGSVLLDGSAQSGLHPDVRIMFQDARLLPWMRIIDNVLLGLPPARRPEASRVLAQVGLGERGQEWPARLSGGQRQRVALARALVHRPRLLLLDEPLSALDALTRLEMHRLIEDIWRTHGFTALLVTHDVHEAIQLADRVILIEDGHLALDARIDLPRPRARTDAAFAELEDRLLSRLLKVGGRVASSSLPQLLPEGCLRSA